jgi:hypothetical protein
MIFDSAVSPPTRVALNFMSPSPLMLPPVISLPGSFQQACSRPSAWIRRLSICPPVTMPSTGKEAPGADDNDIANGHLVQRDFQFRPFLFNRQQPWAAAASAF